MIIYDKKKYIETINDRIVNMIETEQGIKCLFGGAFSTKVYGIDNQFSDFDFYLIFEKDDDTQDSRIFEKETCNDILLINYAHLQDLFYENYPSILFRDKKKEVAEDNYHRKDFISTQKIFEILYSDYIWDSGFLRLNIHNLLKQISVINVLDYYFSRAYGNLKNHLKTGTTDAVRILRTFLNVGCMKWVIENGSIPYMDINFMIKKYADNEISNYINDILRGVKSLKGERSSLMHMNYVNNDLFSLTEEMIKNSSNIQEKPKFMTKARKDFIIFIEKELKDISIYIQNYKTILFEKDLFLGDVAFIAKNKYLL